MSQLGSPDLGAAQFVYRRRQTTSGSILWTVWRYAPMPIRRMVYALFMKFGQETSSLRVTRLPFGLYAKHGRHAHISEAFATQFVHLNTTIPVPAILDVLHDKAGMPFILMTEVPGRPVSSMPYTANDLSTAQSSRFTETVRDWFTQLRRLSPPMGRAAVCGYGGTPYKSYRIAYNKSVEPCPSVEDFHSQWYCTLLEEANPKARAKLTRIRQKEYRVCFTHGDISPHNLLVEDNYQPVGLVDWGCAAWMPEYWELTTSLFRRQRYTGWRRIFTGALPQYEEELEVEIELWKWIMTYV